MIVSKNVIVSVSKEAENICWIMLFFLAPSIIGLFIKLKRERFASSADLNACISLKTLSMELLSFDRSINDFA
jgi:hypothetical protein